MERGWTDGANGEGMDGWCEWRGDGRMVRASNLEEKPHDDETMLVARRQLSIGVVPCDDLRCSRGGWVGLQ